MAIVKRVKPDHRRGRMIFGAGMLALVAMSTLGALGLLPGLIVLIGFIVVISLLLDLLAMPTPNKAGEIEESEQFQALGRLMSGRRDQ